MGVLGKGIVLSWNLSERRLEIWWCGDSLRGCLGHCQPRPWGLQGLLSLRCQLLKIRPVRREGTDVSREPERVRGALESFML